MAFSLILPSNVAILSRRDLPRKDARTRTSRDR